MRRSILFRRIIMLLAAAVLLSGMLSFGFYAIVTQRLYVNMRAKELKPIARTIAAMLADVQQNSADSFGMGTLLFRENQDFGAVLHVYDIYGKSLMIPFDSMGSYDGSVRGEEERPFADKPKNKEYDLSEAETLTLLSTDMKIVLQNKEVTVVRKLSQGASYLVIGVPIKGADSVIGSVFFTKAMSELNDSANGLNLTLLLSTLAAFLLMLVPTYFATKRLVIPIRQMRDVAHAMAEGDFSIRADESQKGEIGELSRSMNYFAIESGRLEQTRRDYVSNVSHELRTPIASIRAMGETLRDGMAKTEEKRSLFYNNIVRESMRLSRLVDDLLELSRLQAGTEAMQKSCFDLREVFQNVADCYGYLADSANLNFSILNQMTEPVQVFSNPDRIEQLLVIFMDNAIKHTPEGGNITLTYQELAEKIQVCVANSGEGIPVEDLDHIFERFYKVDKSHSGGGTGLGLSIAREIIRGLNERIIAESQEDETRFLFTISKK